MAPVAPKPPPVASGANPKHIPATASSTRADSQAPPSHTAASATGAITRAERIRSRSELSLASARSNGGAVATFAAVIVAQHVLEIALADIGPQRRAEDELALRLHPQREIADALLA